MQHVLFCFVQHRSVQHLTKYRPGNETKTSKWNCVLQPYHTVHLSRFYVVPHSATKTYRSCASFAHEDDCSEHVCDDVRCYNGGSCVATGPDSSACLCPLGVSGPRCRSSKFSRSLTKQASQRERKLLVDISVRKNIMAAVFSTLNTL